MKKCDYCNNLILFWQKQIQIDIPDEKSMFEDDVIQKDYHRECYKEELRENRKKEKNKNKIILEVPQN